VVVHAMSAPDADIVALAQQVVEILQLDASKTAWFEPLARLTEMQARTLDGLLGKARVWQFAADLDIDAFDDLTFTDLHDSIVSDLPNWGVE